MNPYTYHHIIEERSGGHTTIENGAILTESAHNLLNVLDCFCYKAYDDLQKEFRKINGSGLPPTNEIMKEIDAILYKVFFTDEYRFNRDISMDKYCKLRFNMNRYREMYEESRKELKMCLK